MGGEAEELSSDRLRRHEKYFGRTNDMIQFKNWQFVKVLKRRYVFSVTRRTHTDTICSCTRDKVDERAVLTGNVVSFLGGRS